MAVNNTGMPPRNGRRGNCCPHPVERHAYNGCAECGCIVMWCDHPDAWDDTTTSYFDPTPTAKYVVFEDGRYRLRW